MDTQRTNSTSGTRDTSFQVLRALADLGPGPQPLRMIVTAAQLSARTVQRRLGAMVEAGLCARADDLRGHYELAFDLPPAPAGLVHPFSGTSPRAGHLVRTLRAATGLSVLLHGAMLMASPTRICVEASSTSSLEAALAAYPSAVHRLRQAPLGQDAAGRIMLAHLDSAAPVTAYLHELRALGYARSGSSLSGWDLLSVPVHQQPGGPGLAGMVGRPRVVGALSVLAPAREIEGRRAALVDSLRNASRRIYPRPPAPSALAASA